MSAETRSTEEFTIQPNIGSGVALFLYSQLFVTPKHPEHSFVGQTVIVTGSNVGLGLEAARHFYRLNCAKLVLAVRTISKGEVAKEDIARSIQTRTDANAKEVWPLDQSSTASTIAFAERVKTELPRVDVVVENAGVGPRSWVTTEGFEEGTQINVLNTFLLALLLLPKLNETKNKFAASSPHLTIVSSEAHRLTKFEEISEPDLYERLNDEEKFHGQERYNVTKLLEVLLIRELVSRLNTNTSSSPSVIINLVNPGLCKSNIDRSGNQPPMAMRIMRYILDRTTEIGARTFILAACAPPISHGQFMSDGKNQNVESWIYTDVGKRAQLKAFEQTMKVLEARKPGVQTAAGI